MTHRLGKKTKIDVFTRQKPLKATQKPQAKQQAKPLKMSEQGESFTCRYCDAPAFKTVKSKVQHERTACKGPTSENQIKIRNIKAKELKVASEAENVQAKELADATAKELADATAKEPKVVIEAGYVEIK